MPLPIPSENAVYAYLSPIRDAEPKVTGAQNTERPPNPGPDYMWK
jgi:hypothetical protein